jgi:hypothetical protein
MDRDGRLSNGPRFVFVLSVSAMMFLMHAVYVMQITKKVFRRPILSKQRRVRRLICECFELCRFPVVHLLTARRRTLGCGIAGIPALGLAWMGEIAARRTRVHLHRHEFEHCVMDLMQA